MTLHNSDVQPQIEISSEKTLYTVIFTKTLCLNCRSKVILRKEDILGNTKKAVVLKSPPLGQVEEIAPSKYMFVVSVPKVQMSGPKPSRVVH